MEWIGYLTVVNIISFIVMKIDKRKAIRKEYRIRERTLFLLAWVGGSVGMYIGMKHYRHKTKHRSFSVGLPLIIFVQIIIMVCFIILTNHA